MVIDAIFLKGAKLLRRAHGQTFSSPWKQAEAKVVACCSVFSTFPSFNDFLKLRVFDIIQKVLLVILGHFLRFGPMPRQAKEKLEYHDFVNWKLACEIFSLQVHY